MGRISAHQIAAAYDLGRRVQSGACTETKAIDTLVRDHRMNRSSATIYIRNLGTMLAGKALKRTMSAPSFAFYLNRIGSDYGKAALANAVASVRSHVQYYASLGRGNLRQVANICDAVEAEA